MTGKFYSVSHEHTTEETWIVFNFVLGKASAAVSLGGAEVFFNRHSSDKADSLSWWNSKSAKRTEQKIARKSLVEAQKEGILSGDLAPGQGWTVWGTG